MATRILILLLFVRIIAGSPCGSAYAQTRVQLPTQVYPQSPSLDGAYGGSPYSALQPPNNVYGAPPTTNYPYPNTPPYYSATPAPPPVGGASVPSTAFPTAGTAAGPYDPYFRPSNQPTFTAPQGWNLNDLFGWNTSQSGLPVYHMGPAPSPVLPTSPSLVAPTTQPYGTMPPGYPAPGVNPQWNANAWGTPQPGYPSSVYPNANPNVLFPGSNPPLNTNWQQNSPYNPYGTQGNPWGQGTGWWNNFWNTTSSNVAYGSNQVTRLCQGVRVRHTWISGSSGFSSRDANSVEINDTDVSLVFGFPNFLNSNRMLYIIPSYSHHLWHGPETAGVDLPNNAFSAFLDAGWDTNPLQTLGMELGVRVGVFSGFDAISKDSIRVQGKALGRLRLTPNSTAKLGVFYLDRNRIKLLPAGGLLWTPNPDSRFDIFFPEPKLSHYVSTVGNTDIWWYLTGFYGGGTWTMDHFDGVKDEMDINDIRIMLGAEFGRSEQIRQGFRLGFVEMGYSFKRELIFRHRPANNLDLDDSFVLRAGLAY